jgi:hypothetical protein
MRARKRTPKMIPIILRARFIEQLLASDGCGS